MKMTFIYIFNSWLHSCIKQVFAQRRDFFLQQKCHINNFSKEIEYTDDYCEQLFCNKVHVFDNR